MSRILLCTFASDRFGRKGSMYEQTQKKVQEIFENNPGFGISDFLMMTWNDLIKTEFYQQHKLLLDHVDPSKSGRAYKPFTISEALKYVDEGDVVIYSDVSPEMWVMESSYYIFPSTFKLDVIKDLCDQNGGILSTFVKWDTRRIKPGLLGIHTHKNFTTDRCMRVMGLEQYRNCFQHASGMMVFRKSPKTMNFVNEWLHWNTIDEACALGPADKPDDYSYWDQEDDRKMGSRADQSISGLLINSYGYKLVDPPHTELNPYNFLNFCRTDVDYTFIDPNINPETERRIVKGDIVINSAGIELKVFEVWPGDNEERYIIGKCREGAYQASLDEITLKDENI